MIQVLDAHGYNLNNNYTTAVKQGEKIYIKIDKGIITAFKKSSYCTATKGYILDANKVILATATFVGDVVTFNYPVSLNTHYYVVVDNAGSNYNIRYYHGGHPTNLTNINYICGLALDQTDDTSLIRVVTLVVTEYQSTGTAGEKELRRDWPNVSGLTPGITKQEGRSEVLVANNSLITSKEEQLI